MSKRNIKILRKRPVPCTHSTSCETSEKLNVDEDGHGEGQDDDDVAAADDDDEEDEEDEDDEDCCSCCGVGGKRCEALSRLATAAAAALVAAAAPWFAAGDDDVNPPVPPATAVGAGRMSEEPAPAARGTARGWVRPAEARGLGLGDGDRERASFPSFTSGSASPPRTAAVAAAERS